MQHVLANSNLFLSVIQTAEILRQSTHASQLISTTLPENTTFSDNDVTCNITSSDISKITIEGMIHVYTVHNR